jgi:hypothetical protein
LSRGRNATLPTSLLYRRDYLDAAILIAPTDPLLSAARRDSHTGLVVRMNPI